MGYRIELWTEHEDNGAAIHALATRVGDESLTLTSGEEVPAGEWVAFEVKLADGSVFLEGMGRCQASIAKEPLWDIELGMLQLETRDQMLFERIQLAADDLASGARTTGEVDVAKLEEAAEEKKKAKAPPLPPALPKVPKPIEPEKVEEAKVEQKAEAKVEAKLEPEAKSPPALPKKKKWPWQKTTEPGMPSPDPIDAPKPSPMSKPPPVSKPPPPPVSKPPPPVSKPPPATVSKPPSASASVANIDPPLPPVLRQRLMNVVPNLVAEGRVRDLAGAHELALRIGLQALETFLEDED